MKLTLQTLPKALRSKKAAVIAITAVAVAGASVAVFSLATSADTAGGGRSAAATSASAREYKELLESQVDTAAGEPRDGRDPANQRQTSLADAASTPNVSGNRNAKPAAGVSGDNHQDASHDHANGHMSSSRINSAGCFIDYGKQGEQCLPAGLADDGKVTCAEVRSRFASGISVTGSDHLGIDTNKDGVACGSGD